VLQARDRALSPDRIESVGKRALDESGKYPVNENDEEICAPCEDGNRICVARMRMEL
jgi:hypothetical protein